LTVNEPLTIVVTFIRNICEWLTRTCYAKWFFLGFGFEYVKETFLRHCTTRFCVRPVPGRKKHS